MNYRLTYSFFCLFFLRSIYAAPTINSSTQCIDENTQEIRIDFTLHEHDFVYHDMINLSVDHPDITLSAWQSSTQPITKYDPAFKETEKIYAQPFTIALRVTTTTMPLEANIHLMYYSGAEQQSMQTIIPINFNTCSSPASTITSTPDIDNHPEKSNICITQPTPTVHHSTSWHDYISDWVTKTDSFALRILLVLLLGLLLSLTPCIYPMIPITVGILQAQAQKSILRNFLISSTYTLGVATTYACLGLLAAFTGQKFGSLLTKPWFVGIMIGMLFYLALSMIGLYEMYIPRFLQPTGSGARKRNSFISAFTFGAISGTVASPCLSPGLILLLTLVTTLANKFMGFVLLFVFGIGISIPLLIIGTFSGSLTMLPRAGMWMVEIKQFFGFIMLGMCIYFLMPLIPAYAFYALTTLLLLVMAIFYLHIARGSILKNILGILLIATSVLSFAYMIKAWIHRTNSSTQQTCWLNDYTTAYEQAIKEQKKILVDVTGPFCSICTAIEHKIFTPATMAICAASCISVKIDISDEANQTHMAFLQTYKIFGAPTILLINPETEQVLARWDSRLYESTADEFIAQVKAVI